MTYKYKAKNGQDFVVPGIGSSKNGIIEVHNLLEAPSLELVVENIISTPIPVHEIVNSAPLPTTVQSIINTEEIK